MYQDWMENTPIFGEIKDVYIKPESKFNNEKDKIIFYKCDGKEYHYGLIAFNHCLVNLEKVN